MAAESSRDGNLPDEPKQRTSLPLWAGLALVALIAVVIVLLGLLAFSVMERRWEAQRPQIAVRPLDEWEPNNAVWGMNYPLEYESYMRTKITETRTMFGGADPRDYLEIDPFQVVLFAGYGFAKEYLQARGHYWSVQDVTETARLVRPFNAGTCWTCKSTDVPRLIDRMGAKDFYAANFHDLADEIEHPIGCQDCHDPQTLQLQITRPALIEAFEAMGRDITQATHQEMRSLVCAQCHVEYYFRTDPDAGMKNYLVYPWEQGTTVEDMLAYYDGMDFRDYVHAISGTPIVKAQHPDWELYRTGIHAYRGVSCTDCHMPYRTEGGVKYTDHHVQSPLLNVANSCAVCHRWEEEAIIERVEAIQQKTATAMVDTEQALVRAHFDVAAAVQAGATAEDLGNVRTLLRHAQFRWDYISSGNGMGFHSPQESMRVLGDAVNQAQQARIEAARILARQGVLQQPEYPDVSTREKARTLIQAFIDGEDPNLVP